MASSSSSTDTAPPSSISIPKDWPVVLADCGDKGRGLRAARDIGGGEVVVQEVPVLVWGDEEAERVCARCLSAVAEGPRCEGCGVCRYCSDECLKKHAEELHPPSVCKTYVDLKDCDLDPEQLNLVRYLVLVNALRTGEAQPYEKCCSAKEGYESLAALCSGWVGIDENDAVTMAKVVETYVQLSGGAGLSAEEARRFLEREQQNSLGITFPREEGQSRSLRGSVMCPRLSLVNHACYPTAARCDYVDNPAPGGLPDGAPPLTMLLRAIQPIPAGGEVTISYAPLEYRVDDRREHLLAAYGITCDCDRCKIEDKMENEEEEEEEEEEETSPDGVPKLALYNVFMTRYLCPDEECGGTLVPIRLTLDGSRRAFVGDIAGELSPEGAECNTCYRKRTEEEFHNQMQAMMS